MVGAPHFLSSTTLRPLGPSVIDTASASLLTPASRARRASSSNFSCFDATWREPPSRTGRPRCGAAPVLWTAARDAAAGGGYFLTLASTSRADRTRYSSPSTLTSVPPYFE